jgi:hypothetical protein
MEWIRGADHSSSCCSTFTNTHCIGKSLPSSHCLDDDGPAAEALPIGPAAEMLPIGPAAAAAAMVGPTDPFHKMPCDEKGQHVQSLSSR